MTCGDCKHSRGFIDYLGRCEHPENDPTVAYIVHDYDPECESYEPARQPAPTPNSLPRVFDLVTADLTARLEQGVRTYGTPLQPHNGRDAMTDAYHEALDLAMYLRQAIFERDGK